MTPKKLVILGAARNENQKKLMEQIEKDGVCPFCPKYFAKYHPKPILRETKSWFVTENMNPYEGTHLHLLLVPKKHVTFPHELSQAAKLDLFQAIEWCTKEFKLPTGSILLRFGNPELNGSSVKHIHAHIIVGNTKSNGGEKIKVKVGYYD